jgi:gamma-glutamylcyclotransferase (GGCT)/AIG2-like uncharacterized protein YtfP
MESDLVFVYGTLRSVARADIHDRYLGRRADFIGNGTVAGKLWRVSWYPALTLGTSPEDRVVGEVYRLRRPAEMLAELDRFEVCDLSRPEESEYTREIVEVRRADEEPVSAWCYRYLGSVAGLIRIISGDFAGESV